MASWGRVVAGVVIGVAGTIYATNEDVRKRLPKAARDLPDNMRHRFESAVSAGRNASARRREEILRDLEDHGGGHHTARGAPPDPDFEERSEESAEDPPVEERTELPLEGSEQRLERD